MTIEYDDYTNTYILDNGVVIMSITVEEVERLYELVTKREANVQRR